MKQTKIQHPLDYEPGPGTQIPGISETIPDCSYTISQILERAKRGVLSDIAHYDGKFDDEELHPDDLPPERREGGFDLADLTEAKEELVNLAEAIKEEKKRKEKKVIPDKQQDGQPEGESSKNSPDGVKS